jgi:anaerobic magnesium-protoporphyrin IX monomethyl ester cyclase
VRACGPDDIGISVSYPLPGTTFYQRVRAQLGDKQNWVDSNDLAMMYHATYVPDFYRALHALVHAEFRSQRAARELRRGLARPSTIGARHLRAVWQCVSGRVAVPVRRQRVEHLSRVRPPHPAVVPLAVLSPQAAAMPTEQPQ